MDEEEEAVVLVKSKEVNKGNCSMLRVVEEVASWPSIHSLEEEYRREQMLGSGRFKENNDDFYSFLKNKTDLMTIIIDLGEI